MVATSKLDLQPIFGSITDLLDGAMKDELDTNGWTFVEQLARDMLLSLEAAAKPTAKADARARGVPQLNAAVERAEALNAPKNALLKFASERKFRDPISRRQGCSGPSFWMDLPFCFEPLDPKHGKHVYLPLNRHYKPLNGELGDYYDYKAHANRAWHFRGDPREIEDAWADASRLYVYTAKDIDRFRSERAFREAYLGRLRRLLAAAVPGVGGLAEVNWDWIKPDGGPRCMRTTHPPCSTRHGGLMRGD